MKYVITGGSGYIGGRLIELLSARDETERIVNVDVRPPSVPWPKCEYIRGDVRDRASIKGLLEREKPDSLVHLAFLLDPIHDEARMYDIDVNGTQAVLWAASEAGIQHVLVASSASAYGAFPDNPLPIAEDWPVRGQPDFSYACHKAEADRVCQLWAADHPDRVMTIIRPAVVYGPNVNNYLWRTWETNPFMPILDGVEQVFQTIHEDDVVSGITGLLDAKAPGAFNFGADGMMTWREGCELTGVKAREISFKNAYRLSKWSWRLHLPNSESPAGSLSFLRYPWVVSNEKLKATVGWEPRYDTRETFLETIRAKGLESAPAEVKQSAPAAA
jgi:UDP-glucose 4-epimerase